MTQVAPDASVIDLGVPGVEDWAGSGQALPVYLRRQLLIAVVALSCLFALVASVPGRPSIGDPLWTGSVSLNGFALGPQNLYMWRLDGRAAIALDLFTGRPRWSRDTTEQPESITDLGNGIAVVTTRPPAGDGPGGSATVTVVRDATGEAITQTTGDYYVLNEDGRLLLVFTTWSRDPDGCAAPQTNCAGITAVDVGAGAVAWRFYLAPNSTYLPSIVDGRVEALAEIDNDGTVRLRNMSTGAVAATMNLSPEVLNSGGQVGLLREMLLTAQRGPDGITLTAYERPSLRRSWSVVVPDFTPIDEQRGDRGLSLWDCGPDACMTVSDASTRVINQATGAITPPIPFQVIQRLGGGVFLASPLVEQPVPAEMGRQMNGLIVDSAGRTLGKFAVAALVDWSDSRDRALVTQEGPDRTEFLVIDGQGSPRSLGTVPGTRLTCHARADILACSDPGGTLRVWRLPR